MSKKLDGDINEWAGDVVAGLHKSGFAGINCIEKILRDPGISTNGSKHRVLWWPRSRAIARVSRAMHQIDPISQVCLIVVSRYLLKDDGTIFGVKDLKSHSSLSIGEIRERARDAKRKINGIIERERYGKVGGAVGRR